MSKKPIPSVVLLIGILALVVAVLADSKQTKLRPIFPSLQEPAAGGTQKTAQPRRDQQSLSTRSNDPANSAVVDDDDPDLPPDSRDFDKSLYLRLREEYIGRLRGIEPGRPFDSEARGRAIRQMNRRQADIQFAVRSLSGSKSELSIAQQLLNTWVAAA